MIRRSYSREKNVVRWFIGKRFGLIIGVALTPGDYFYSRVPGNGPVIWVDSLRAKLLMS